jgi:hypothetical protein
MSSDSTAALKTAQRGGTWFFSLLKALETWVSVQIDYLRGRSEHPPGEDSR